MYYILHCITYTYIEHTKSVLTAQINSKILVVNISRESKVLHEGGGQHS